jgi:hypothetical protein
MLGGFRGRLGPLSWGSLRRHCECEISLETGLLEGFWRASNVPGDQIDEDFYDEQQQGSCYLHIGERRRTTERQGKSG